MSATDEPPHSWTPGWPALALGMAAGLAVLLTLGDPGLTIEEPLDVRPGRNYVATLRARGWHFFDRDVVDAVYRDDAEHPPLGRWLLGIASTLGWASRSRCSCGETTWSGSTSSPAVSP